MHSYMTVSGVNTAGNTDEPTRLNSVKKSKTKKKKTKRKTIVSKSFETKVDKLRLFDEDEGSSFKNDIDTDEESSRKLSPINIQITTGNNQESRIHTQREQREQ